jgi:pimeloyl-ACP methyl ester carboxylesterase
MFIHGLMGSSQGVKASLLKEIFPEILTPDFTGTLDERLEQLDQIVCSGGKWKVVGSSLGGLMAAIYSSRNPERIKRMVLLSPALTWPDFANALPQKLEMPVVVYLAEKDTLLPLEDLLPIVEQVFSHRIIRIVDDEHNLHNTLHKIDWKADLDLQDTPDPDRTPHGTD